MRNVEDQPARPGKEAREIIERSLGPFGLSRTLTKKVATAILDEFRPVYGETDDGEPMLVLLRDVNDTAD